MKQHLERDRKMKDNRRLSELLNAAVKWSRELVASERYDECLDEFVEQISNVGYIGKMFSQPLRAAKRILYGQFHPLSRSGP